MSKAKVRNGARRIRSCLKSVRELLLEYGCVDTMTVREAVTRLIADHGEALDRAQRADARAEIFRADALLAWKIRDGARTLATKNHEEARALRRINEQLRHELEVMRGELAELRCPPTTYPVGTRLTEWGDFRAELALRMQENGLTLSNIEIGRQPDDRHVWVITFANNVGVYKTNYVQTNNANHKVEDVLGIVQTILAHENRSEATWSMIGECLGSLGR